MTIQWQTTATAMAARINFLGFSNFGLGIRRPGPPSAFAAQGVSLLGTLEAAGGAYDAGSNDTATTPYALAIQAWAEVAEPLFQDLDAIARSAIAQYGSAMPTPTALASSVATSTSTSTLTPNGGGLDGPQQGQTLAVPSTVSVTTAPSPTSGSFNTGTGHEITVNGTDANGDPISSSLVLYRTGGGETAVTPIAFSSVTSIAVPAQVDTQGRFSFGLFGAANPAQLAVFGIPAAAAALPAWQPLTTYPPGAIVSPTTTAGAFYYVAIGGFGTSGSSAPLWPTTLDGEVADGGVLWTAGVPVGGSAPAALPWDSTLPSFPLLLLRAVAAAQLAGAAGDVALQGAIDAAFLAWAAVAGGRPSAPGGRFFVSPDVISDELTAALETALANAQAWMQRSPT